MPKLPIRSLKIGSHRWKVIIVDLDAEDKRKSKELSNLKKIGSHALYYGEADFSTCTIRLNSKLNDQILGETLLHEILHVLIEEIPLTRVIKRENEENVVQGLGHSLVGVLRDNAKLLDIIRARKKRKKKPVREGEKKNAKPSGKKRGLPRKQSNTTGRER
jgi:hypothetical protein